MVQYYSVISSALSNLPSNSNEARFAIYDRARATLQESLSTHDPPISDAKIAHELFALEAAICKVEEDLLVGIMHRFVGETPSPSITSMVKEFVRSTTDKLNHTIRRSIEAIQEVSRKHFAHSLVFAQTQLLTKNIGRRIYLRVFGEKR